MMLGFLILRGATVYYSTAVEAEIVIPVLTMPLNEVVGRVIVVFGLVSALTSDHAGRLLGDATRRTWERIRNKEEL